MTAEDVIQALGLTPLRPEGGYFRRTYTSPGTTVPLPGYSGSRHFSTAIYYLLTPESFSAFHRLPQDELFHFYLGDPVQMCRIDLKGTVTRVVLGPRIDQGQKPQELVPGNVWQATQLLPGGKWALLGCTVTPGFDEKDYVHGSRTELTALFPQHSLLIESYTRP